MDDDGFIKVTKKRASRVKKTTKNKNPHSTNAYIYISDEICLEKFAKKIELIRSELNYTGYSKAVEEILLTGHGGIVKPTEIVCYGIGAVGVNHAAQSQLALLLNIKDFFKLPAERVFIYDPVLTPGEYSALEAHGLTRIDHNEECRRPVHCCTLFYMPHIDRCFSNNLLISNWSADRLGNILLIGNSFNDIELRFLRREIEPKILQILPHTVETRLPVYSQSDSVFNNLSLHTFSRESLEQVDEGFWTGNENTVM